MLPNVSKIPTYDPVTKSLILPSVSIDDVMYGKIILHLDSDGAFSLNNSPILDSAIVSHSSYNLGYLIIHSLIVEGHRYANATFHLNAAGKFVLVSVFDPIIVKPTSYENKNVDIAIIVNNIRKKIKKIIELEYGNGKEVYADLIQIVRWFPGMEQQPHADDMKNIDDADKWFNHRDFGAILYLNDDYEGGITYYPEYELGIIPKSGRLAIHPGDSDHLHGVTKIENVNRYTIASFWTFDKSYESDYSFIPE
jgi:hypothetical protein